MIINRFNTSFVASLIVFAAAAMSVAPSVRAGGPREVRNGRPVIWARNEVRGGRLNSQTVDASGRVLYRVDSGALGTLSNEKATRFVDRIFKLYTDIPTATIEFVNAGRILDTDTGSAVDVDGTNFGKFLSPRSPTFQNPIIFDSDGAIVRELGSGPLVLGLFGVLAVNGDQTAVTEGIVVLNGQPLTRNSISEAAYLGVFTHEFGHFAGPLDHSQINGNIALDDGSATLPPGFSPAQAFDLYAPFTETMFPFVFNAPPGSQLGNQLGLFRNLSGLFVASLDLDTQNALSNLYPTPDYGTTRGSIQGRVLIRTGGGDIAVTGINVVARRIDQGAYPPSPGTQAFSSTITLDGDGVPQEPSTQAATDSLATVSSAVTGLEFGAGTYRIQGLPPGQYLVEIQQINPEALGGSGIGSLDDQLPIPVPEFYNGGRESNDSSDAPADFVPVFVTAGSLTTNIDIILNLSTAPPVLDNESEPNEKTKKAQRLNSIPVELLASASSTDLSLLRMNFPNQSPDGIEDLYRFTVPDGPSRAYFIIVEPTSGSGDLDLYLFDSNVSKKRSSLDDPSLLSFSAGPSSNELIGFKLSAGTYIIGISAFDGSQGYRLRIIPAP